MIYDDPRCPLCNDKGPCPKSNIPHGIKYEETCSICWEQMIYPQDQNLGTFEKCGHTFHNVCIQTWIRSNSDSTQISNRDNAQIIHNNIINNNIIIELQNLNPTSHWCFDHVLNQWVLIDNISGYLSWQEETPESFSQDYTPVWLNYPRFVRYRRKWILVPNEDIHLYTSLPRIPESYIPNGIFDSWIFDDDLSYYVLVNNETGYLSWQEDIPEINFSGYTPHWIDSPDKYNKRWILDPDVDHETQYTDDYSDQD